MEFSETDLEAYLDESLDPARASELESCLKKDKKLIERLSQINGRRDAGIHTLSEVWRQNQIGVASREEVVGYVAGTISDELADYIHFRLEVLKCRFTNALLVDVESQQNSGGQQAVQKRRKKYIDSSAGLIKKRKRDE